MAAVLIRPSRHRSRLRLFVVQVMFASLFLTLFARLWYLQVFTGEEYQAKAAEQSVREIVAQPARGLIVDAMGRPLVTNRPSWVVSVDRTVLGKLTTADQEALLRRVAAAVHEPYADLVARTRLCGQPGAVTRNVLERLAVPAGAGGQGRAAGHGGDDLRAGRASTPGSWLSARASAPTRRRSASMPPTCSAT